MKLAEERKTEGNAFFMRMNYLKALELYTQAIQLCPNHAAYYGNRSAAYIRLNYYAKALEDARKSVQIDPKFIKGHMRIAKCHCAMGEITAAINACQIVLDLEPTNKTALEELQQLETAQKYEQQGEESYEKRDFKQVVSTMNLCIQSSPFSVKYKIRKAECLVLIKEYEEANKIVCEILAEDSSNADAIYVCGLCLYYQNSIDKAFQHFQQVLRLDPDHTKAQDRYRTAKKLFQKNEEGNQAFRNGNFQMAYDTYTEALTIDSSNFFANSRLSCNRAAVLLKLGKFDEAIEDFSLAIEADETYIKAYQLRAKCYLESENYEEALKDAEKAFSMDRSRENHQLLKDAKLALATSKDYYKVLGVPRKAGEDEIKKAFRKLAKVHHPDRHSNATHKKRKEHEKKFKVIGEAYSVLSDPKKKERYDSGQDLGMFAKGFPGASGGSEFPGAHFKQQRGFSPNGYPGGSAGFSDGPGFPGAHFQQQRGFPPEGFPGGSAGFSHGTEFPGAHCQQQRSFPPGGCPCESARFSGGPGIPGAHVRQPRGGFLPEGFHGGSARPSSDSEFPGAHFQQQRGGFFPQGFPGGSARFSDVPGFPRAHVQQQRGGFPPERFPGGSAGFFGGPGFPGAHFQQQKGGFCPEGFPF